MTPAKTRKHTILMTPAAAERTWSVCPPFCFLDQPLLSPSSAQSPQFGNYLLAINIRIIWRFHHLKPFQNCSLSWHRLPRQRIIWADVHPTCTPPSYTMKIPATYTKKIWPDVYPTCHPPIRLECGPLFNSGSCSATKETLRSDVHPTQPTPFLYKANSGRMYVHPACPHPIYKENFRSDVHLTCLSLF